MDFILNNPFRVLGLPATATQRMISKRISDLEICAEFGQKKSYPYDFPILGSLDRSAESVKDAARKIENTEGHLLHSFFWFRTSSNDSVDELALEMLESGNIDKALELWDNQFSKKGSKKHTWRINRSVLRLLKCNIESINKDELDKVIEDFGFVIDDDLEKSIQDIFSGSAPQLNRENLWKQVVNILVDLIQFSAGNSYGRKSVKIIKSFWSFPLSARDYLSAKIVNPIIEDVKNAITHSEKLRENNNIDSLTKKNQLDSVEWIIKDLSDSLGNDDVRLQSIANLYADEICDCAVKAINDFDDPKLAMMLIQWAKNLPSFSRVKSRIEENFDIIEARFKQSSENEIFEGMLKKLEVNIYTLNNAAILFDDMKRELHSIKSKIGGGDDRYINISSAGANKLLDFYIKTVNSAQESFLSKRNFVELNVTISRVTELTRMLLQFDLDSEMTARIKSNLEIIEKISNQLIEKISNQLTPVMTKNPQPTTSSNSIIETILGWIFLIGIVSLVSMCS